jgi:hypothetical protein
MLRPTGAIDVEIRAVHSAIMLFYLVANLHKETIIFEGLFITQRCLLLINRRYACGVGVRVVVVCERWPAITHRRLQRSVLELCSVCCMCAPFYCSLSILWLDIGQSLKGC